MALEVGTERPNTVKKRATAQPAPIGEKLLTLREESLDAQRRFGQPHARLFPFLGRKVLTPAGA